LVDPSRSATSVGVSVASSGTTGTAEVVSATTGVLDGACARAFTCAGAAGEKLNATDKERADQMPSRFQFPHLISIPQS
jgi:hypothetical protein